MKGYTKEKIEVKKQTSHPRQKGAPIQKYPIKLIVTKKSY